MLTENEAETGADTLPDTGETRGKTRVEVTLRWEPKTAAAITAKLRALYGASARVSLETLVKRAVKETVRAGEAASKIKRRRPPKEEAVLMEKKYLTSAGKFIKLGAMNRNHAFNAARKMERTAKFLRDAEGNRYEGPDDAFPSTERFAGYADLVNLLKLLDASPRAGEEEKWGGGEFSPLK